MIIRPLKIGDLVRYEFTAEVKEIEGDFAYIIPVKGEYVYNVPISRLQQFEEDTYDYPEYKYRD